MKHWHRRKKCSVVSASMLQDHNGLKVSSKLGLGVNKTIWADSTYYKLYYKYYFKYYNITKNVFKILAILCLEIPFSKNSYIETSLFFFATIVKLNSQNNCIKSFPFRRYKEKQISLLAALRKDSNFDSQKNPIKRKAPFPQWSLKTCKFNGVSNTEEQFDFPSKLIPVVHRFLEGPLVAASDYYHNHILISKKCYFRRKIHHANVLIKNKSAFS